MTTFNIFNADCLEKMKDIPDKSVDLIICDLPYGELSGRAIGKNAEKKKCWSGNPDGCQWDIKINLEEFWKQIKRIRKNEKTATIHFCSTRFGVDLINSNPKEFRHDLVWNKMRGVSFLCANRKPMTAHEMVYVFSKVGATYNRIDVPGEPYVVERKTKKTSTHYNKEIVDTTINTGTRCVTSVINHHNRHSKNSHPTAKPADLYTWLISRYSNEGDLVLDPTFGSCNSGIACRELNRNYIGIEMNKEFYDAAVERLNVV